MKSGNLVYVVVLGWNHVDDTIECLDSMVKSDYHPLRFILVDNGSEDNTVQAVRERFPNVDILHSDTNLGVSGGYNIGMEYAYHQGADYILIANNDISADALMIRELVAELDNHPEVGIGMPKIFHYYGDRNRLWCTGAYWRKFPPTVKMLGTNAKNSQKYSNPQDLEFVPSCCLLLRRDLIKRIGYFDTGYFFYNDDWDYSARSRKAGYSIRFVPKAILWHKVSISTQKSEKISKWWNYLGRSTVRFYRMHKKPWQLRMFIIWFVIRESIKGKFNRIKPFLAGVKTEQDLL
jgi:GT2 family glycosyltransferase